MDANKFHFAELGPTCPHCDMVDREYWDWQLKVEEAELKTCGNCSGKFWVELESPRFSTWDDPNEEKSEN